MTVLIGGDLVLTDRVLSGEAMVIANGLIESIQPHPPSRVSGDVVDLSGHFIVPGFIDVHIHGIEGVDVLDSAAAVADVAARLPKFGVTAFCPTSVACAPARLQTFLQAVADAERRPPRSARVLPAHLESNFISPEWNGAQPAGCLRVPPGKSAAPSRGDFDGGAVLDVIRLHRRSVGIVTLAPELPGGLDLVRELAAAGHRVSLGHTGATYQEAMAAIEAGARHATHLFNRMSSMTARSPGVVGAVLESNAVTAEVICDGHHVHPAMVALALRAKSISRVMAITDGTAAAGLAVGSRARLGDQAIIAGERTALLEDGTLAGSTLTMDGAFRMLLGLGLTLPEVARLCSSTAAEALRLNDTGAIQAGNRADFVILDRQFRVRQTYIAGVPVLEH